MSEAPTQEAVNEYLDNLRESGKCNMFEGPSRLIGRFGIDRREAYAAFETWTETFEDD